VPDRFVHRSGTLAAMDVCNRNVEMKGGNGAREHFAPIPQEQNDIRRFGLQHRDEAGEHSADIGAHERPAGRAGLDADPCRNLQASVLDLANGQAIGRVQVHSGCHHAQGQARVAVQAGERGLHEAEIRPRAGNVDDAAYRRHCRSVHCTV
jgi:hypothetical protein